MPKVTAIDAKTGQPQGEVRMGRSIKATTQTQHAITIPEGKVEGQPPQAVEGQPNKAEGSNTAATPLDPKFEALAKKEAAFRIKERDFHAREAALKDREAKTGTEVISKADLLNNPLEILNSLGVTYDDLVQQAVNMPDPATREIKNELKTIREAQAKLADDAQKSAQSQYEAAVKQIRYDVADLIDADPQFETIKNTESSEDVVELITKTFNETGKLLTVDSAAKLVEDELFAEALRISNLGKVQAHNKPKLTPEVVNQAKQQGSNMQQQMTTLTNNMSSSRPLSPRERAIKRFKGEQF